MWRERASRGLSPLLPSLSSRIESRLARFAQISLGRSVDFSVPGSDPRVSAPGRSNSEARDCSGEADDCSGNAEKRDGERCHRDFDAHQAGQAAWERSSQPGDARIEPRERVGEGEKSAPRAGESRPRAETGVSSGRQSGGAREMYSRRGGRTRSSTQPLFWLASPWRWRP